MAARKIEQLSREDIVGQICVLQKQIRMLRRVLQASEEASIGEQQCPHQSRILVDSGPRDNGELTYQCRQCGAYL